MTIPSYFRPFVDRNHCEYMIDCFNGNTTKSACVGHTEVKQVKHYRLGSKNKILHDCDMFSFTRLRVGPVILGTVSCRFKPDSDEWTGTWFKLIHITNDYHDIGREYNIQIRDTEINPPDAISYNHIAISRGIIGEDDCKIYHTESGIDPFTDPPLNDPQDRLDLLLRLR